MMMLLLLLITFSTTTLLSAALALVGLLLLSQPSVLALLPWNCVHHSATLRKTCHIFSMNCAQRKHVLFHYCLR
jgi:hypothetical protein